MAWLLEAAVTLEGILDLVVEHSPVQGLPIPILVGYRHTHKPGILNLEDEEGLRVCVRAGSGEEELSTGLVLQHISDVPVARILGALDIHFFGSPLCVVHGELTLRELWM